jgi:hypothetical protein
VFSRLDTEAPAAFIVESKRYERSFLRIAYRLGVGEILAGDDRSSVDDVKRPVRLVAERGAVASPTEHFPRRDRSLHLRQRQIVIDLVDVSLGDVILAWHLPLLDQL